MEDGELIDMPVLFPMTQRSPDIVAAPQLNTQPQYKISEAHCERVVFIWELHDDKFPAPVIPVKQIINPLEPDRDSSQSIVDLMDTVPSGRFIRGQEINKLSEWQLYLQNSINADPTEVELQVVLKCEKIYVQASVHTLAKVACEIIDDEGAALWSSGDVYASEVKPFSQGNSHAISLGKKVDLQCRRAEFVKNGILRLRLRLNIYKDLAAVGENARNNNEIEKPPAKRRRLESGVSAGLTDLLCSLESLWKNRLQTGDITIVCKEKEIKAHRFILTGRSKVFMKMLTSKMSTIEKSSGEIIVDDITPEIMTAVLEYIYLGSASRFDWTNVDNVCALIYAAEKYWISPLLTKCYQNLMKVMNLENFAKIAKVTFMYNCGKHFKDEVRHFFESNQITLNGVESFRTFAQKDFAHFHSLFFYVP